MSDKFLGSIGFNFPETEEELENFERVYSNYELKSDINKIDPKKILKSAKEKATVIKKPTNIDYHKRTVLAAEIVYQLRNEYTLGHLKLQKLIYLCNHLNKMSLHVSFLKQAMGPYDNRLRRSIEKKFRDHKWFEFTPGDFPLFKPLENVGGHKEWYEQYYGDILDRISWIIELFRKEKSDNVELVATIYACWLEALENRELVTDKLIIYKVNNWSEEKRGKFSDDQIIGKRAWMMDNGLIPLLKSRS